jgi:K+-transporting ATPase ATPase C chain
MFKQTIIALRVTIVTLVLTGLIYPMIVTGLARAIFSQKADGSLVKNEQGQVVGSALIGQGFSGAAYFQPRPSAAGSGYDATASSGSNLGPTSAKLKDRVTTDTMRLQRQNPEAAGLLPADLVMASASGLDPHITPEAAYWQVARIAKARQVANARIMQLVETYLEGRDLGFLGEPRVNVLLLNLALDRQFGKPQ